ncbi:MAG: 3-mercaptopyruvate sulfurtransferase [Alphaproteobacteria bacterium MarineAlpha6_Bin4]|nr:MAG: 3-mercaptopyruvate sulfurtransferase [Alphaproteobacteria bacterium MarineAlpha6_Bin3]PPR37049.1 MAG: 3-mercaptopyruvate sulfurtransferase [Alphaproteobacteria bacterium MarineAlpha6_Bin4]|tara:strand:+ start:6745 stop:7587 length:843 start_codon:yes stop_codon:yes gene_type:complete
MSQLIEIDWLKKNLNNDEIKIIDGTWHMPGAGVNAFEIFKEKHIPNSIFVDLELISDPESNIPHMMPNEDYFSKKVSSFGINNNDHLIIYDMYGMFSAARIWFMFKAFGHKKVSLLNGGLPAWIEEKGKLSNNINKIKPSNYKANLNRSLIASYNEVFDNISQNLYEVIDARSPDRFLGSGEEPRPGIKSGHIPGSKNIFFNNLIDQDSKKFLKKEEIKKIIKNSGIDEKKDIICTCGSGVTACILKFAIQLIDKNKNIKIYDGSWSEWGTKEESPCEKN